VIQLLNWIYGLLRPGGKVLVGNFDPRSPDREFMDHLLEWRLNYRTPDDMRSLLASSNFGDRAGGDPLRAARHQPVCRLPQIGAGSAPMLPRELTGHGSVLDRRTTVSLSDRTPPPFLAPRGRWKSFSGARGAFSFSVAGEPAVMQTHPAATSSSLASLRADRVSHDTTVPPGRSQIPEEIAHGPYFCSACLLTPKSLILRSGARSRYTTPKTSVGVPNKYGFGVRKSKRELGPEARGEVAGWVAVDHVPRSCTGKKADGRVEAFGTTVKRATIARRRTTGCRRVASPLLLVRHAG